MHPSAAIDNGIQPPNMFSLGGDCGRVLGTVDWAHHVLGPITRWPQSLVTALSICLSSRYPICILWGPKRIYLYNDAYAPIVGAKHPAALAQGYPEVWPEIWDTIRPILEQVELTGESSWSDNLLLVLQRHGFNEECYFAFSFAPVRVEDGSVGGVFTAITETTAQIVGERRLRALRELGAAAPDSRTIEGAIELAARVVAQCSHDVPFALFYQTVGETANLAGFAGADSIRARFPAGVKLVDSAAGGLPFAQAMQAGEVPTVVDLTAHFGLLNSGPWPEPVSQAVIMPIRRPGEEVPYGFFVAGLSPRRPWDEEYRNFLSLLDNQIAASIANAVAYTEERARSDRLRELDRAKTAFFSNVSHEFRTPLTLMLGPLEEEMRESPSPRERLQVVHRNSLRLLKLVNTLLDFSRIEAGRTNALYEPTDLATYTSELASAFRSATDKAGLRLIVDCPPLAEPVYLDRGMWEKIVFNLLSNAFKFTFEGEIEVKLRDESGVTDAPCGQVCLSVRDTGTGIPAAELPRVFERFHRVQNARSRSHEGTGIGLALVAELARLHGGTVRVESTEGIGTTFFVLIAKGISHLPQDRIPAVKDTATAVSSAALIEEVFQWLPGDPPGVVAVAATTGPFKAVQPGGPGGGARPTILLADDNRDMRDYVSRLLIAQNYEVEAVTDGQAALEAISRRLPSLVLSDVMMPGMNGFELLQRVRSDEALRTLPIILLSARAGEEARVEGAAQGADDYLTKPFSARELLARVAVHLELARVRQEAESELRRSEERYRAVVDNQVEMLCRFRPDGTILFVNGAYARSRGVEREALLGANFWDFIPVEDRSPVRAMLDGLTPSAPQVSIENRFETATGPRWTLWTNRVTAFDEQGRWTEAQSTGFDITDRRQVEEALRASEARLRLFIQHAPAALAMFDREMRYLAASQRWKKDYGLSGELLGRSHYDIFPDLPERWKAVHARGLAGEILHADDDPFPRGDGTIQFIKWEVRPWQGAPGEVGGILIVAEDVTQRKQATEKLRESEAQQSFLLRIGDALRQLADPVEIQAAASRILGEHLGASRVAFFEVRGADYFVARDYVNGVEGLGGGYPIASFGERLLATYRNGQTACSQDLAADVSLSSEERAAYAGIHIGAYIGVPLVKAGEFVAGLTVHSRDARDWKAGDISLVEKTAERTWEAVQRARADAALRQARQRFDIVKDSTRVGFWFCDLPFDKLEWDDRVKEHFWLPPDAEVTINTFYERMHPGDREPTRRAIDFSIANKSNYETEFRTVSPDAQVKWVRAIGRGYYGSEGEPVRFDGITLDITESKQARELLQDSEARLREGQERLQAALNGSGAGTFRWNIQTNVLEWDENLDRLFGLPPGQTIRSLEKFLSVVHPAERPGAIERCNRCAREGANFDMEFRIVWPDGSIRWLRDQGATYRDAAGQPFYMTGMCLDITESKQAEETLRTAKELAEAASRAKDDFLAALSHELRTPLTPVLMTAAALKDDPRLSEDIREELGMMERNIALEARLIDDLLDLTAISHGKLTLRLEPCDLTTLVKQVMEMVAQDARPKNLVITCEFGTQQSGLMADPTRLQQVIWNLLRNAVKFTPPGGKISVCTRGTQSPDGNPRLTLEIADTGIGIEAAHIAKIFQPFDQGALSGSHRFGGLGLGLAIAHAVVISHGGRIHARSEGAGRGATFVVDLPHAVPAAAPLASPTSLRPPSPPAKLASLRLLLVEDHESTLQTLSRILRRDGHHVTTTTTIAGAQTAATQETFDLVISDLGLPDGGGTKLMEKLRSSYGLRGIALSGYGMQEDIDRSRAAGFVAHLVKPIAISDLRRTLEEVSRT